MDVYLVPIGRGRFESYFEAPDDDDADPVESPGLVGRMRARFTAMLRDAERARHQTAPPPATGLVGSMQRRLMRWIAERVAEQRLLWHLGRATTATLHVPDDQDARAAERIMRDSMQRDADRHLRQLALNAVGLVLSAPIMLLPGPNLIGYFFTFTVVGHFLALRGARRGLSRVTWDVKPSAELSDLRRALSLDPVARHRGVHEVANRLRLRRLATFVERMAAPTA